MLEQILGTGLTTRLQLDAKGGMRASAGLEKVRESILTILGTRKGERIMRPNFGCELDKLVFAPNNAATASLAQHYVEESLMLWEPRIELTEVNVANDNANGRLNIDINYKIRATNQPQNLVYPFYLQNEAK